MRKLTLKLDDLDVTSFMTAASPSARIGTVQGRGVSEVNCEFSGATCYGAPDGGTCNTVDSNFDGCSLYETCECGMGGGGTIGVHCGAQGTMNPAYGTCVINTQAGATCDGSIQGTCGANTACC